MTEAEAIARLKDHFRIHDDGRPTPKLDEAVDMAIKALEKQIAKKPIVQEVAKEYGKDTNVHSNDWIPCSERLPKEDERVLCFHSHGFADCGVLINGTWCCDMDEYAIKRDNVIAWMPLPPKYEPKDAPYQKGE